MIRLEHVTKSYKTRKGRHYVFKDLSLEFPEGKSIGVLGRNGAGKSTMLRLLGRLDFPDSGRIVTNKSISWPVGQGSFQYTLTGRENVRFVAQIYGYNEKFVKATIDKVADFADLGKFFDMPVKTYSTGMKGRLAFGISMAFDFDYYLMDEVFSAGDPSFRVKCDKLMKEKKETSAFLIVSHAMGPILRMCDMAVVLTKGQVDFYEDVREGIKVYQGL
jgi:capsular polysaccharide transport system ATP-binding protein